MSEESNPAAEPAATEAPAEEPASAVTEGEESVSENPTDAEAAADAEAPGEDVTSTEVVESGENTDANVDGESDPDAAVTEEDVDLDAPDEDELDDDQLVELISADPKKAAAELKKARREAAEGRVRARDAEQANRELYGDQVDDEFVSTWAQLGRAYAEAGDDVEAQAAVRSIFADLAGIEPTTASPLSPAEQIDQLFARREEQHARKAAEAAITLEIKELGYNTEPESGSNDEANLNVLRAFIASQPDGQKDLKAAHEAATKFRSTIFEEELAKVRASGEGLLP
jgi:hypothetical protein